MAKAKTKILEGLVLIFLLFIHTLLLLNLKFTAWPEMLSWPYLLLSGFLPYRDIAIAHNPLLILFLGGFYKLTGVEVGGLQIFTWGFILIVDLFVFYIAEKIFNFKSAVITLSFYILLQIFYEGNGMWFDLFLVPFYLATFYILLKKKYFWVGAFWAVAFLIKQTAVWFLIPIGLTMYTFFGGAISRFSKKDKALNGAKRVLRPFIFGVFVVLLPFVAVLFYYGIFQDYFYWAVKFGIFTLPLSTGQISYPTLSQIALSLFPLFPFLLLFFIKDKSLKIVLLFGFFGLMGALPRFELFHFQPGIPFFALAASVLASKENFKLSKYFFVFYFVIFGTLFVRAFFRDSVGYRVRFFEPHVLETAVYIEDKVGRGGYTYILNAWENLYPFSGTLPATKPLVPHLSWYMEKNAVQEKIVSDLKDKNPRYLFVGEFGGGDLSSYIPKKVINYITEEYGVVNIVNNTLVYEKLP